MIIFIFKIFNFDEIKPRRVIKNHYLILLVIIWKRVPSVMKLISTGLPDSYSMSELKHLVSHHQQIWTLKNDPKMTQEVKNRPIKKSSSPGYALHAEKLFVHIKKSFWCYIDKEIYIIGAIVLFVLIYIHSVQLPDIDCPVIY